MSRALADLEGLILRFGAKYAFDESHARTVARLTAELADRLAPLCQLQAQDRVLLHHAALVHDVGYFISGRRHHRHSAYLIRSDAMLADYPAGERRRLGLLAQAHRKRIPKLPRSWPEEQHTRFWQSAALLRIADGLDYHHEGTAKLGPCTITPRAVRLRVAGLDLLGMEKILRRKSALFADVFGREASFVPETAG